MAIKKEFPIIIENIGDKEIINNQELLFKAIKVLNCREKLAVPTRKGGVVIIFENEDDRKDFLDLGNKICVPFGEKCTYRIPEERKYKALIFKIRNIYSEKFTQEQIKVNLSGVTNVVLFGEKGNQKTARVEFKSEKCLAEAISKRKVKIGYFWNQMSLPLVRTNGLCLNCGELGHKKNKCKKTTKCMKCGDQHKTELCNSKKKECINCKGPHSTKSKHCLKIKSIRMDELENRTEKLLKTYNKNGISAGSLNGRIEQELKETYKKELTRAKRRVRRCTHTGFSKLGNKYIAQFAGYKNDDSISVQNQSHNTLYHGRN